MNNLRRSLPDNTNRHALILTHSLSRFTLPRCALHSDNPRLWDIQLSSRDFCEIIVKVMSLIRRLFLGFRASHKLREDCFGSRLQVTTLLWPAAIPAGFHPWTSDPATGYSCDRPQTHAIAKRSLTDRQRFSLSLGCFPPKETRLDTPHTQRDSCVIECRFDFRDTTSEQSSLFSV